MIRIPVDMKPPYQVHIESGLLQRLGDEMARLMPPPRALALIADDQVDRLYGQEAVQSLEQKGFRVARNAYAHGEANKNLRSWQCMLEFLSREHITRSDAVIALGGGITGDMAGFAAASYLRGIPLVHVPTSLLAMVDSCVGGKTAVNLPQGKNLAGAFHQPQAVFIDPSVLRTLPREAFLDGMAEAIKTAMIGDHPLFNLLAKGSFEDRMEEVIAGCLAVKARLVAEDERDQKARQWLNLGHTFGHALESSSGYAISHGRAVAIGMGMAARLAERLGLCEKACVNSLTEALRANGLPVAIEHDPHALWEAILQDKKREGELLTLVLPQTVGKCIRYPIAMEELEPLVIAMG